MTKQTFAAQLAKSEGCSLKQAEHMLDTIGVLIINNITKGEPVKFRNFGTFCTMEQKGRTFKNPKTKEISDLPPRYRPVFIPSEFLKKQVRDGEIDD